MLGFQSVAFFPLPLLKLFLLLLLCLFLHWPRFHILAAVTMYTWLTPTYFLRLHISSRRPSQRSQSKVFLLLWLPTVLQTPDLLFHNRYPVYCTSPLIVCLFHYSVSSLRTETFNHRIACTVCNPYLIPICWTNVYTTRKPQHKHLWPKLYYAVGWQKEHLIAMTVPNPGPSCAQGLLNHFVWQFLYLWRRGH